MNLNKRLFIYSLGTTFILIILVMLYSSLTSKAMLDLVYIGNTLTLISFPFLIIGLTLLVIQSGNFDFFLYSFRPKKKGYNHLFGISDKNSIKPAIKT